MAENSPSRSSASGTPATQIVDGLRGIVRLRGHLTAHSGALMLETIRALHGSGHARVRLDLGALEGADDAGLDALGALQRWADVRGHSLVLAGRTEPAHP